jgi:hypothetical protein
VEKMILAFTILIFLASAPIVMARGNHRFALDQKWKEVQQLQKRQDDRFKAIERDAERGIKALRTQPEAGGRSR